MRNALKKILITSMILFAYSCTTTSYTVQKELSKIEECKSTEPFFSKSRICIKQSVIASQIINADLVNTLDDLVDILETRLNQNKLSNDMAWKLLEDNLIIAIQPTSDEEAQSAAAKINTFIDSFS